MSDLVLWGASYMVHLQWIDTHVATLLVACGGFGGVTTFLIVRSWWFIFHALTYMLHTCWYAVHSSCYMSWYFAATSTLLMVPVHEVTYMLATELKNGGCDEGKSCQKRVLEMMGHTIPCKYHWKCVLDPVLMAFRGHFPTIDVHKTLRGLQKPLHTAAENVDFVRGLEPPCYHVLNMAHGYGWCRWCQRWPNRVVHW